jgi:pimeloyl-ACP methyl ester carboxylesterase
MVSQLVDRNLKAFGIELTDKKKTHYQPRQRQRVDLADGWYCYITDSRTTAAHTVLTLHGAPGDHVEWAGLEAEVGGCCRWVNLTTPGFDGEDERRGSYDGSAAHFAQLIVRLLAELQVRRVILCAHSLGSIFSSYFITHFPQCVAGYINITGIVDHWYTGLLTFVQTCIT